MFRFVCALVALFLPSPAFAWPAAVLEVYDGDTVAVTPAGVQDCPLHVRLYGIDAPEMGQGGGKAARDFLAALLPEGAAVEVIPLDKDKYGRVVGLLIREGKAVNAQMVEAGHAWVYKKYCRAGKLCRQWRKTQNAAQRERRGLWADGDAVPPWMWRKKK